MKCLSFKDAQREIDWRATKLVTQTQIICSSITKIFAVRITENTSWWWGMEFFKIDGYGGLKVFARKGAGKAKWGEVVSRNGSCHTILRFFWRFLMIQHSKKISMCLSFVNKHLLQNNCSNKIWDDLHCNSFNSFDNYNSSINCSCK